MEGELFEKAERLWREGRILLTDETDRALYFRVLGESGEHYVRIMSDRTFNCTCTWGSLRGSSRGSLCSHVLACLLHEIERRRTKVDGGEKKIE